MTNDGNSLRADEDQFTPLPILAALFLIAMTMWGLIILAALTALT